jgi:hypothetical protein
VERERSRAGVKAERTFENREEWRVEAEEKERRERSVVESPEEKDRRSRRRNLDFQTINGFGE